MNTLRVPYSRGEDITTFAKDVYVKAFGAQPPADLFVGWVSNEFHLALNAHDHDERFLRLLTGQIIQSGVTIAPEGAAKYGLPQRPHIFLNETSAEHQLRCTNPRCEFNVLETLIHELTHLRDWATTGTSDGNHGPAFQARLTAAKERAAEWGIR